MYWIMCWGQNKLHGQQNTVDLLLSLKKKQKNNYIYSLHEMKIHPIL